MKEEDNNKNVVDSKYNDDAQDSKLNKIFKVVWKVLLVVIVFTVLYLSMIQFGIITLVSSVVPDVVVMNQNEVGIKKGAGYQLVTTVLPVNASNKQIVYESSDPSVATVNEVTGYVTALSNGVAKITAKTLINDVVSECVVKVGNDNVIPTSLNIKNKNIDLAVGYTHTLSYTITPSNANNINLNFSSSDSSVASVNSKGIITGIKAGNAVITVSANNNIVYDTAYVTVYKKGEVTIVNGESVKPNNYPSSVAVSDNSVSIISGSTKQLEADIYPNSAISNVSWTSTNPDVAEVNEYGMVVAKSEGTADIVAKTINNLTSVSHVSVGDYSIKLKKIYLTTKYSFLQMGMTKQLYVAVEPKNASNPTITWSSSDPKVVSVDKNGFIKALSIGTAVITAKSSEGNYVDKCTIEVGGFSKTIPVTSISLNKSKTTIYVKGTEQITPSYTPSNATYKTVSYYSSDPSVVTVDSNGLITGIKEGSAVITVRTNQDNISVNMNVTVIRNVAKNVKLTETSVTISKNDTYALGATVTPANASDKTVTYVSDDQTIATVDKTGIIKGIKPGTTTITVTPNGGGSSSTCLVTVN